MPGAPAARRFRGTPLLLGLFSMGCELQEVVVAVPEDLVVAEIYLQVGAIGPRGFAYLHRSAGVGTARVPDARIELTTPGGSVHRFHPFPAQACVTGPVPLEREGSCYVLEAEAAPHLRPGSAFHVRVDLPGGGILRGTTTLPGDFAVVRPAPGEGPVCSLPPGRRLELTWTPAAGAWAYVAEAEMFGLRELLAPLGIEVEEDPLILVGLAISRSDTTIVFPSEFGVFDRADLSRELLAYLQNGIPDGASASLVVAAGDRNYVNWVRGGSFNPSGQVRVPSLLGTGGTGVFGSQVVRRVLVQAESQVGNAGPPCSGVLPPRP